MKIKGGLIPEWAVESMIGELQDFVARHKAGAAISAKALFKSTKNFHTVRRALFSALQKYAFDKVMTVSASANTKLGWGGSCRK